MNTESNIIIDLTSGENQTRIDGDILEGYRFRSKYVATTPKPSRYIRVDDPPPAKPLKVRRRLLAKKKRH